MSDIKRHNTMVELENCSLNIEKLKKQLEEEIEREKKIKEKKLKEEISLIEYEIDDYLTMIKKQIQYKKVCLLNYQYCQYYMARPDVKRGRSTLNLRDPMCLVKTYCKELDNYSEFYEEYNKRMSKYVFDDIFKILPIDHEYIINEKKYKYKEYFIKHLGPYQKEEAIYKSLKIINERLNKIEEKLGI